jgi:glycosyltransferase involved in cell wall biosynthesis
MRVLYITAEVPYPLTSGYLRHFHILRGLSVRHDVTLLSLTRRLEVSPEATAVLGEFLTELEVVAPSGRGRGIVRRAERVLLRRAAARRLARRVRERLDTEPYDVVLFSGKDTFPALEAVTGVPVVVDVCDAASLRLRGQLELASPISRPALAARLAEIRRVERRIADATPHLLFASDRDRTAVMGDRAGGEVVPNAVDLDYWRRSPEAATGSRVVLTGVMSYPPNHDAAMRLAERILPRVRAEVPDAELVVAGRDPQPELLASAETRPWLQVTGAVADLRPEIEAATVYCAPLRFASGIQNKVLEALAMEVPVVTTPVVADGVRSGDQEPPLVIESDDDALAAAIVRLLRTPEEYGHIAVDGRRYVEQAFSWPRSVAAVEGALHRAAGTMFAAPVPAGDGLHVAEVSAR